MYQKNLVSLIFFSVDSFFGRILCTLSSYVPVYKVFLSLDTKYLFSFRYVSWVSGKGLSTNNFGHASQILSIKQNHSHPPPPLTPVLNGQNQKQMKNTHPF